MGEGEACTRPACSSEPMSPSLWDTAFPIEPSSWETSQVLPSSLCGLQEPLSHPPILFRMQSDLVGAYKAHCPRPCLPVPASCPLPLHSAPATPQGLLWLRQLEFKLPEGPPGFSAVPRGRLAHGNRRVNTVN